ncbi:Saccharopine dehydrogenase-like oxidoreductase [Chlorella vulgaris]
MKPSCRFKPKHVRPVSASGDGAVARIADATAADAAVDAAAGGPTVGATCRRTACRRNRAALAVTAASTRPAPPPPPEIVGAKKVVILGGCGRVGSSTAAALTAALPAAQLSLSLGGRSQDSFRAALARRPELSNASPLVCDIDDSSSLAAALKGADLVIHAAGPFQRRNDCNVLEAAIAAGVPYMDVCDDTDYSQRAKALHGKAQAAGVPCITTTGIYPGTGGAGPTIMETTLLLAGEDVVAYKDGQRTVLPPVSNRRVVDFGTGVGRRSVYLYNLPEVSSGHQVLGVPSVSARFGTAPEPWNWGMVAMARLAPKSMLADRQQAKQLARWLDPVIRGVDSLVGEKVAMLVEVEYEDGKLASGLYVHPFLSTAVGTCIAAFARCMLAGQTQPGVWFPEERGALADRKTLLGMSTEGCTRFLLNRTPWQFSWAWGSTFEILNSLAAQGAVKLLSRSIRARLSPGATAQLPCVFGGKRRRRQCPPVSHVVRTGDPMSPRSHFARISAWLSLAAPFTRAPSLLAYSAHPQFSSASPRSHLAHFQALQASGGAAIKPSKRSRAMQCRPSTPFALECALDSPCKDTMVHTPRKRMMPSLEFEAAPPAPKRQHLQQASPGTWRQLTFQHNLAAAALPAALVQPTAEADPKAALMSPALASVRLLPHQPATPACSKELTAQTCADAVAAVADALAAVMPPPPLPLPADACAMAVRRPVARRLLFGADPAPAAAEPTTDDFLAALEQQGRERFAERWGFDTRLGQPLPDHPRFTWVLDETRT